MARPKENLLILFMFMVPFITQAQQQRIGYRLDSAGNNVWRGIDSFVYDYNSAGNKVLTYAVKEEAGIWNTKYKYTYTFDANQNLTAQLKERYMGGWWENENRYAYTYDANNNQTLVEYFTWVAGAWRNTGRIEHTGFNSAGKPAETITKGWDGNGWVNSSKLEMQYLPNPQLKVSENRLTWNTVTASWDKFNRQYYTYYGDSIGSVLTSVPDTNNNWKSFEKYTYTYNSNFLRTQLLYQLFDSSAQMFNIYRYVYNYTASNKIQQIIEEDAVGNGWVPTRRMTYLYNTDDSLKEHFSEVNSNGWVYEQRSTYTLNAGLITEIKNFDSPNGNWVETNRRTFQYDANKNNIMEQLDNHMIGNYQPVKREFHHYNQYPLLVENKMGDKLLRLYPNPVINEIWVQYIALGSQSIFEVYDLHGRKRMTVLQPNFSTYSECSIDLSILPSGIYTLTLKQPNGNIHSMMFTKVND